VTNCPAEDGFADIWEPDGEDASEEWDIGESEGGDVDGGDVPAEDEVSGKGYSNLSESTAKGVPMMCIEGE